MKVKAIAEGFFAGHRRRKGALFEVPEGTKASWFVPVAPVAPLADTKKPEPKKADAKKAGTDLA